MSDSVAGAAAWLGGIEIVNDSRTAAYLRNGIKPGTLTINGDCGCDNILALAGCDDEYTTPEKDQAPWYDSSISESAEFAGFLTTEFEGLGSTFTRTVSESIGDGATLGRSRFGSRTLTWKGLLFGSSCCGVAYGLRWLGKTLQGTHGCGNNCFGDDLELLVCCPTMEAALGLGPDLICNSNFEIHTGFWSASGDTALTRVVRPTFSGGGALKTVNPIGGAITFNTSPECVISVLGNKGYKLSVEVKGATGSTSSMVQAVFRWFNDQNSEIGTPTSVELGVDNDLNWTHLEAVVAVPLGAVTTRIDFTVGHEFSLPNEAHIFDEIHFNQIGFAPVVDPFRTLKGVALMEGPIINSQRKMGGSSCGGRCGGSAVMEIEFSLVGSQPWLYGTPIPVVNCVQAQSNAISIIGGTLSGQITNNPLLVGATTINSEGFASLPVATPGTEFYITLDPQGSAGAPESVLVTAHTAGSTVATITRGQLGTTARQHAVNTVWILPTDCSPVNCADGLLAEAPGFQACAPPELPPTAVYVGCAVPDVNTYDAVYITAPRTLWDSISEVVPVITIQTGGLALIGARLGFFTSADGNPCADLVNNPPSCDLVCDTLNISVIPGNSKFYIDGRTKKMSLVCGTNAVFPGEPYTLGPFSWPSFDCYGFCMEFAYDPAFTSDELCISLSLVPRTTL